MPPVLALFAPLALLALAGCGGGRDVVTFAPEAAGIGETQNVLVASSRRPVEDAAVYSRERSATLDFARFTVSVPPDRPPGTIGWPRPGAAPDPARDFLVLSAARLPDAAAFAAAVDAELDADGIDEAAIFVHGFNVTFAEGLYRQAQIMHDFALPDVAVNYAWPSAGSVAGYVFDKESAIFAGVGLADLVPVVARSGVDRVLLIGHSMGSLVVMEAVRHLHARGDRAALDRIHAVVLLAPDLDLDIFRQQMPILDELGIPVYVFTSARDRALRAAARLQGGRVRLGALTDPAPVADLPVVLIDVSEVSSPDFLNHSTVAESPMMIGLMRGLDEAGEDVFADLARGRAGPVAASVSAVEQATRVILDPLGAP